MQSYMTVDQIQGLSGLLDSTNGQSNAAMSRPASQSVGYSLAETDDGKDAAASGAGNKLTPNANPGAIYVPESMKIRDTLPTPSMSKDATETNRSRPKPKGNDIWATEEVDYEVNMAPKPTASTTNTNTTTTVSSSSSVPTAVSSAPAAVSSAPPEQGQQQPQAQTQAPAASTMQRAKAIVDRRAVPEHEILYKQTNTAEDVYLAMDFTRDGSTAMSCESLAVKVKLPLLESVKDIELDVDPFLLTLRTRDYHLKANLPERVIAKKGNAQWDAGKKVLTVLVTVDPSDKKVKVM